MNSSAIISLWLPALGRPNPACWAAQSPQLLLWYRSMLGHRPMGQIWVPDVIPSLSLRPRHSSKKDATSERFLFLDKIAIIPGRRGRVRGLALPSAVPVVGVGEGPDAAEADSDSGTLTKDALEAWAMYHGISAKKQVS
ncbi:hypothetical protein FZEAL_13 [Fusarium zealandicum]|uniref:Uncharacterized protein n=1 Tax=Fusarium zealandicum TaxID=1053134 RepID=A0A8H4XRA5_9HYPO|nr:hypothetical protein FZEAL_13 [Fusarium zealandicum]